MILRREGDRLIAVRQVDHARFSGQLTAAPFLVSIPSVWLPPGPHNSRQSFLEACRTAPSLEITGSIEPV